MGRLQGRIQLSSVTPSDTYRDNSSRMSQLEEELRQAASRQREKQKEDVESLQASHERDLRRQADEYERTLARSKSDSQSLLSHEREAQKSAEEIRKRDLYDRNGKTRTSELESNQRDLEAAREDFSRQAKQQKTLGVSEQERYEQKIEKLETEHQRELDHAVQTVRDQVSNENTETARAGRESDVELKASLEKKYQSLNRELMEQIRDSNHKTQAYMDELKGDYAIRSEEDQRVDSAKRDETRKGYMERELGNATRLRDSHVAETKSYRDQANGLGQFKRDYMHEKAEGRSEGIREVENDFRDQAKVADQLYRNDVDGMKRKSKEQDGYFNRLNDRTLRDKDRYYAEVISHQNQESRDTQRDTAAVYEKNLQDRELRSRVDQEHSQASMERQAERLNASREEALGRQNRTFTEELDRNRISTDSQIKYFKEAIHERDTGDDIGLISEGAERRLREQLSAVQQKQLDAEVGRNTERFDRAQRENHQIVHDLMDSSQKEKSLAARVNNSERQSERGELLQHLADTEFMKETTLHEQGTQHERQIEKIQRSYGSALEQQRRNSDEMINTLKVESDARLQGVRQELDFNSKMAQRAFSQSQNELIRGYEKKLADQKTDYDALLSQTKTDVDSRLRETDRKSKFTLDEQARGYEQKIAQLEQQQKERERLVASNYEEEMEKVKRSNALLIRKKS